MTFSRFDNHLDRTTVPTSKWSKDRLAERFGNGEALPFWVADMDFQVCDSIFDEIVQRANHGIYGYTYKKESYFDTLTNWFENRHGWHIEPAHIEACPTVLSALSIVINQHSDEGDGIIIQPPVFHHFETVIKSNKRQLVKNSLKLINGQYQINFDDLEEKAADPNNKIMIICNPHNPIGRLWTKDELERIGTICKQHHVLVISDEIHCDIVYPPHQFTAFSSISEDFAQNSVTCLSPAKTFNIAGIVDAFVVIPNDDIRNQFHDFTERYRMNATNVFSLAATEAAYGQGGAWLDELLIYLQSNVDFLRTYLETHLPEIKLIEPESTYLAWVDFRELSMEAKMLEEFLSQKAAVALNAGYAFGQEGAGFARMNIACSQQTLEAGLLRLTKAVRDHS